MGMLKKAFAAAVVGTQIWGFHIGSGVAYDAYRANQYAGADYNRTFDSLTGQLPPDQKFWGTRVGFVGYWACKPLFRNFVK